MAKEEWELSRLQALKEEEERRQEEEEDEMLYTYTRDDAMNQVKSKNKRLNPMCKASLAKRVQSRAAAYAASQDVLIDEDKNVVSIKRGRIKGRRSSAGSTHSDPGKVTPASTRQARVRLEKVEVSPTEKENDEGIVTRSRAASGDELSPTRAKAGGKKASPGRVKAPGGSPGKNIPPVLQPWSNPNLVIRTRHARQSVDPDGEIDVTSVPQAPVVSSTMVSPPKVGTSTPGKMRDRENLFAAFSPSRTAGGLLGMTPPGTPATSINNTVPILEKMAAQLGTINPKTGLATPTTQIIILRNSQGQTMYTSPAAAAALLRSKGGQLPASMAAGVQPSKVPPPAQAKPATVSPQTSTQMLLQGSALVKNQQGQTLLVPRHLLPSMLQQQGKTLVNAQGQPIGTVPVAGPLRLATAAGTPKPVSSAAAGGQAVLRPALVQQSGIAGKTVTASIGGRPTLIHLSQAGTPTTQAAPSNLTPQQFATLKTLQPGQVITAQQLQMLQQGGALRPQAIPGSQRVATPVVNALQRTPTGQVIRGPGQTLLTRHTLPTGQATIQRLPMGTQFVRTSATGQPQLVSLQNLPPGTTVSKMLAARQAAAGQAGTPVTPRTPGTPQFVLNPSASSTPIAGVPAQAPGHWQLKDLKQALQKGRVNWKEATAAIAANKHRKSMDDSEPIVLSDDDSNDATKNQSAGQPGANIFEKMSALSPTSKSKLVAQGLPTQPPSKPQEPSPRKSLTNIFEQLSAPLMTSDSPYALQQNVNNSNIAGAGPSQPRAGVTTTQSHFSKVFSIIREAHHNPAKLARPSTSGLGTIPGQLHVEIPSPGSVPLNPNDSSETIGYEDDEDGPISIHSDSEDESAITSSERSHRSHASPIKPVHIPEFRQQLQQMLQIKTSKQGGVNPSEPQPSTSGLQTAQPSTSGLQPGQINSGISIANTGTSAVSGQPAPSTSGMVKTPGGLSYTIQPNVNLKLVQPATTLKSMIDQQVSESQKTQQHVLPLSSQTGSAVKIMHVLEQNPVSNVIEVQKQVVAELPPCKEVSISIPDKNQMDGEMNNDISVSESAPQAQKSHQEEVATSHTEIEIVQDGMNINVYEHEVQDSKEDSPGHTLAYNVGHPEQANDSRFEQVDNPGYGSVENPGPSHNPGPDQNPVEGQVTEVEVPRSDMVTDLQNPGPNQSVQDVQSSSVISDSQITSSDDTQIQERENVQLDNPGHKPAELTTSNPGHPVSDNPGSMKGDNPGHPQQGNPDNSQLENPVNTQQQENTQETMVQVEETGHEGVSQEDNGSQRVTQPEQHVEDPSESTQVPQIGYEGQQIIAELEREDAASKPELGVESQQMLSELQRQDDDAEQQQHVVTGGTLQGTQVVASAEQVHGVEEGQQAEGSQPEQKPALDPLQQALDSAHLDLESDAKAMEAAYEQQVYMESETNELNPGQQDIGQPPESVYVEQPLVENSGNLSGNGDMVQEQVVQEQVVQDQVVSEQPPVPSQIIQQPLTDSDILRGQLMHESPAVLAQEQQVIRQETAASVTAQQIPLVVQTQTVVSLASQESGTTISPHSVSIIQQARAVQEALNISTTGVSNQISSSGSDPITSISVAYPKASSAPVEIAQVGSAQNIASVKQNASGSELNQKTTGQTLPDSPPPVTRPAKPSAGASNTGPALFKGFEDQFAMFAGLAPGGALPSSQPKKPTIPSKIVPAVIATSAGSVPRSVAPIVMSPTVTVIATPAVTTVTSSVQKVTPAVTSSVAKVTPASGGLDLLASVTSGSIPVSTSVPTPIQPPPALAVSPPMQAAPQVSPIPSKTVSPQPAIVPLTGVTTSTAKQPVPITSKPQSLQVKVVQPGISTAPTSGSVVGASVAGSSKQPQFRVVQASGTGAQRTVLVSSKTGQLQPGSTVVLSKGQSGTRSFIISPGMLKQGGGSLIQAIQTAGLGKGKGAGIIKLTGPKPSTSATPPAKVTKQSEPEEEPFIDLSADDDEEIVPSTTQNVKPAAVPQAPSITPPSSQQFLQPPPAASQQQTPVSPGSDELPMDAAVLEALMNLKSPAELQQEQLAAASQVQQPAVVTPATSQLVHPAPSAQQPTANIRIVPKSNQAPIPQVRLHSQPRVSAPIPKPKQPSQLMITRQILAQPKQVIAQSRERIVVTPQQFLKIKQSPDQMATCKSILSAQKALEEQSQQKPQQSLLSTQGGIVSIVPQFTAQQQRMPTPTQSASQLRPTPLIVQKPVQSQPPVPPTHTLIAKAVSESMPNQSTGASEPQIQKQTVLTDAQILQQLTSPASPQKSTSESQVQNVIAAESIVEEAGTLVEEQVVATEDLVTTSPVEEVVQHTPVIEEPSQVEETHLLEEQISTSPVEEVVSTIPKEALGLSPVPKTRSGRSRSTQSGESGGEESVEPPKKFVLTNIPSPTSLVGALVIESEVVSSESAEPATSRRSSRRASQNAGEDLPVADNKITRRRSTLKESSSDAESKTPVTETTDQIQVEQQVTKTTENAAPVKRGRGRPRKSVVEEKEEESSDEEEVPVARETRSKRTESREDVKENKEEVVAKEEVVVKRGRGRPRKESRESTPSPAARVIRPTRSGHSTPTFAAPSGRSRSGSRASSTVDSSSEIDEETTFTSPRPTRRTSGVKPEAQPSVQMKRLPQRASQSLAGDSLPKKIAEKRASTQSLEEEVVPKKAKAEMQSKKQTASQESDSEDEEIILRPQPKKKVEPYIPKSSPATSSSGGQEISPKQISPTGSSPPVIGGERKGIFEQLTPIKKKSWRDEMDIESGHIVPHREKGQLPYISPARMTASQVRLTSRSPPSAKSRHLSGSAHARSRPVIRPPSPPKVTTPPKPKHVNPTTSLSSKMEPVKPSEPHRGRGRPPKNPSAALGTPPSAIKRLRDSSASGSESDLSVKTEPKRGRGRPPKNLSPAVGQRSRDSSASGSESSRRGRKPKVQDSSGSESEEEEEPSPRATRGSIEDKKRTTRSKSTSRR